VDVLSHLMSAVNLPGAGRGSLEGGYADVTYSLEVAARKGSSEGPVLKIRCECLVSGATHVAKGRGDGPALRTRTEAELHVTLEVMPDGIWKVSDMGGAARPQKTPARRH